MTAIDDIAAERQRQMDVEGWSAEHDDSHPEGALAAAAAAYALSSAYMPDAHINAEVRPVPPECWPWDIQWWKPGFTRQNLVKAGALIAAAIDREDRALERVGKLLDQPSVGRER